MAALEAAMPRLVGRHGSIDLIEHLTYCPALARGPSRRPPCEPRSTGEISAGADPSQGRGS